MEVRRLNLLKKLRVKNNTNIVLEHIDKEQKTWTTDTLADRLSPNSVLEFIFQKKVPSISEWQMEKYTRTHLVSQSHTSNRKGSNLSGPFFTFLLLIKALIFAPFNNHDFLCMF